MKKITPFLSALLIPAILIAFAISPVMACATLEKRICGPGEGGETVLLFTELTWTFHITIDATDNLYDVVITDKVPAEFGVFGLTHSTGVASWQQVGNGKAGAKLITWTIGDMMAGDTETLEITIKTLMNPSGKNQEFTSCGQYTVNYGAYATFVNPSGEIEVIGPVGYFEVYACDS